MKSINLVHILVGMHMPRSLKLKDLIEEKLLVWVRNTKRVYKFDAKERTDIQKASAFLQVKTSLPQSTVEFNDNYQLLTLDNRYRRSKQWILSRVRENNRQVIFCLVFPFLFLENCPKINLDLARRKRREEPIKKQHNTHLHPFFFEKEDFFIFGRVLCMGKLTY